MKKRLLMIATLILSVAIALGVAACSGNGNKPDPDPTPDPKPTQTIVLSESVVSLERYKDLTLTATTEGEADGGVIWKSSDDTVVSVADGRILALKAGTATVTATYGTASATCEVTVSDTAGKTPTVKLSKSATQIFKDGTYVVEPILSFDGVDYDDATFTFTSSAPEIVSAGSDGTVTGLAYGTAVITVTGNWRGAAAELLTAEIRVKVVPDVSVEILDVEGNKQSVYTIYTVSDVEGTAFGTAVTATAKVLENRAEVSFDVAWNVADGGDEIITVADGVITSKGVAGETTVTASVTVAGEEFESVPVTVRVERPAIEKDLSTDVDLRTGLLGSFNPFGEGEIVAITDVTDPAEEIDLNYNEKDGTIDKTVIDAGERKWRVYNDTYGYEIDVIAASIIVKTPQDLVDMYGVLKKGVFVYEGYVILAEDLDFSGFDYKNAAGTAPWSPRGDKAFGFYVNTPDGYEADWTRVDWKTEQWLSATDGFTGTFDGRGHVIRNLKFDLYGMFPVINAGSTFKNVAFINADVWSSSAVVAAAVKGTVENVYIEATANNTWNNYGRIGGVTMALGETAVLKNVVSAVDFTTTDRKLADDKGGSANHTTIEECGIIAAVYKNGATLDNVYAIGNGTPFSTYPGNVGGDVYDGDLTAAGGFFSDAFQSGIFKFSDNYWDVEGGIPQWKNLLTIDADVKDVVVGALTPITVSDNSNYTRFMIAEVPEKIKNYVSVSETTVTVSEDVDTVMTAGEILTFKVGVRFGDATKAMNTVAIRIIKPGATATLTGTMLKGTGEAAFAADGITEAAGTAVTVISGGAEVNGAVVSATLAVRTNSDSVKYLSVVPETALNAGDTVTIKAGSILKIGETYYLTAGAFTQIKVTNGSGYASGDYCALETLTAAGNWGAKNNVRFAHKDLGLSEGTAGTIISGQVLKNGEAFSFNAIKYGTDHSTRFETDFADYDRVTIKAGLTIQYADKCYRFTDDFTLVYVPTVEGAANASGCCGYGGGNWAEPWDLTGSPAWGSATNIQFYSSAIPSADDASTASDGWTHSTTTNVYSDWVKHGDDATTGSAVLLTRDDTTTGLGRGTDYRIRFTTKGSEHSLYILAWDANPFKMGDIVTIKKGSVISFKVGGVDRFFVITQTLSQKYTGKGIWGGMWEYCDTPETAK